MQIFIPTLSSTGAATFTAANGDTMTATVAGQATRTSPTTLSIVEHYTITGGTGRFADATGSFDLESTLEQTTGASLCPRRLLTRCSGVRPPRARWGRKRFRSRASKES